MNISSNTSCYGLYSKKTSYVTSLQFPQDDDNWSIVKDEERVV